MRAGVSINSTSGEVFDETAMEHTPSFTVEFPLIRLRVKSSTEYGVSTVAKPVLRFH